MANKYKQSSSFQGVTRFTQAPMAELEFSKMTADPKWYLAFNAGDIVPIYYSEYLPHDTFSIDLDYVLRQLSTSIRPTMGQLQVDIYAFAVPNRIVNESWKNAMGENSSGYWSAPEVSLAPLMQSNAGTTKIPVGSVADFYGFPTQAPISNEILAQMNDLKFRGYLAIYNEYFRDQNYQAPVPFSKLNIYNGFFESVGSYIAGPVVNPPVEEYYSDANGSYQSGAITKAIYGDGGIHVEGFKVSDFLTSFSALASPLKANKLHDAFTSVLPSPQKGNEVIFSPAESGLPVEFSLSQFTEFSGADNVSFGLMTRNPIGNVRKALSFTGNTADNTGPVNADGATVDGLAMGDSMIRGWNVAGNVDIPGVTINELRTAIATQQVLELLARGGSRYWSFIKSFFGIEVDNPYPDIPTQIGHIRRDLDLYQVAQTSASVEGGTPQGSLTAFGYSTHGGALLTKTFLEHGYLHIFAVVRHRSVYTTYLAPDNFRRNTMDFYLPQLANISEQPIRLATLNPFYPDAMERAIGYQEAWWEYRYEPDRIHGALRSGIPGSLDVWHYGNYFDSAFSHVNGSWLMSDTQEILDRTLAITSDLAPQFIGMFNYKVTKQRPMPVYSIPGLDTV